MAKDEQDQRKRRRELGAVADAEAALRAAHGEEPRREGEHAFVRGGGPAEALERAATFDPEEEEAPYGFGLPPAAGQRGAPAPEVRLPPAARDLARRFPPVFRALGRAARAVDAPLRRALDTLELLGREARKAT